MEFRSGLDESIASTSTSNNPPHIIELSFVNPMTLINLPFLPPIRHLKVFFLKILKPLLQGKKKKENAHNMLTEEGMREKCVSRPLTSNT